MGNDLDLDMAGFMAALADEYENPPSYSVAYRLILAARVPAQRVKGRWRLPRASLTAMARELDLVSKRRSA